MKLRAFLVILLLGPVLVFGQEYSLPDLLDHMHSFAPELKSLSADVDISRQDLATASAMFLPTVNFQSSMSLIGNPMDAVTIRAGQFGIMRIGGEDVLLPAQDIKLYNGMENTQYSFSMKLTQPVFTWGKLQRGKQLAETAISVKEIARDSKTREMDLQLKTLLASLVTLEEMQEHLAIQARHGARLLQIAQDSYDSGFMTTADLLDVRIQVKDVELATLKTNEQIQLILLQIRQLTGITDFQTANFNKKSLDDYAPGTYEFSMDIPDFSRHPVITLLQKVEAIAELTLKQSSANPYFLPDIGIQAELKYEGPRFPFLETDWYGKDDYQFYLSVGFSSLIFDGGAKTAAMKKADAERMLKTLQTDKTKLQLERQYAEAVLKIKMSRETMDFYTLKISLGNEKLLLAETQFSSGYGSEIDVIKAKMAVEGDEMKILEEKLTYYQNVFLVEYLSD